jgi:hypothetical protein
MKKFLFITILLGALYSLECEEWNTQFGTNYNCDCNEENWQEYYSLGDMERCWLNQANLVGANLVGANLEGAHLGMANLNYAYLFHAHLSGTNLKGAILSHADLSGADLSRATLSEAYLSGADLRYADLPEANLSYAYLYEAILGMTDLEGACLEGATGFMQTNYNGTPIFEGCAFEDTDTDGYDDVSFDAGATSVDANNDGLVDDFPSISIIDGDAIILMQESLEQYTDSGASCSDQEDGDISHQVEVSGDIVNMSSPGTYMIFYNCSDSDGNAAQTKHRTVFIIPPIIADENEDGFDDDGFMAGAQSGDVNLDGLFNIVDIVLGVEILLNGE